MDGLRSVIVLRLLAIPRAAAITIATALAIAAGWMLAPSPASGSGAGSGAEARAEPSGVMRAGVMRAGLVRSELVRSEVSFRSGDLTLRGTVIAPAEAGARRPGVVLVHGAGAGTRRDRLMPAAEAFATRGLVTLVYDKRAAGYTPSRRDFSQLADDALAAAALLRTRPEVDPAKVGLWGVSEGGWVVPIAAARAPDLAFIIVIAANGVSPAQQHAWAMREHARRAGVSSPGQNRFGVNAVRMLADADMFAQAHHDPVPVLARVRSPILAIWGGRDNSTPPGDALRIYRDVLSRANHPSYTLRVFPEGNHGIGLLRNGVGEDRRDRFVPGYPELVTSWVNDVTSGAAPAPSADPPPAQAVPSPVIRRLPWWASPDIQLAAFGFFFFAFLAYLVTGAAGLIWRRLRTRRVDQVDQADQAEQVKRGKPIRAARWLAPLGLVTSVGFLAHFVGTLNLAPVGPVIAGRSLPWLVLQVLALAVLVSTVATGWSWLRTAEPSGLAVRIRRTLLLAGGAVFAFWAIFWGLLGP